MANDIKMLVRSCKARRNDETAQLFLRLIEAYKDYYLDQLVYSESDSLLTRQGQVLALKTLYEDLTTEPTKT